MDNLTPVGRIIVWTMLSLGAALFVTYLPSVLGLVTDERYGRFLGGTLFAPLLLVSLVSGVFYTQRRRPLAFWIVGMMLAGLVLLELGAIWPAIAPGPSSR